MGARHSLRSSSENHSDRDVAEPPQLALVPARGAFHSFIKKLLSKKRSSAGHLRLEIKGVVSKYPFWISTSNLKKGGDTPKRIEYFRMSPPDKVMTPCAPRLPNSLHFLMNKTVRLSLRHKQSSISDTKQDHYPEHDILVQCVTRVILHISLSEGSRKLSIQVYEHHRTPKQRRQPLLHIREMKVERVLFDAHDNMAFMGQEFALIVNKAATNHDHVSEGQGDIKGIYMRTMDTCPSGVLTFDYKQAGIIADMALPPSVTHSGEYAKRLLSKSSITPFKIRLSRQK